MIQLSTQHSNLFAVRQVLRPRSRPTIFAKWLENVLAARLFPLKQFYSEAGLNAEEVQDIIANTSGSTKGIRRDAYEAACYLMDRQKPFSGTADYITNRRQTSVYFTGRDGQHEGECLNILCDAIDAAQQRVLVMAYWLTAQTIINAFDAAAQRGVSVAIIYDPTGFKPRKSHAKITLIPDTVHSKAHNKVVIIDDETVFTGSFNFTGSADDKNAENLLEIRDPVIIEQYVDYWQRTCQTLRREQETCKHTSQTRTRD